MTYRWLTDLPDAFDALGLPYQLVDDWDSRGRPNSTGEFDPTGVLCHHTASPEGTSDQSELNVLLAGNSEAPGPISQLLIGREYRGIYVVAAGRANHAGSGLAPWLGDGKTDGNAAMIGIEVSNDGSGEPWPDWQIEMYALCVHALNDHYGFPLDNVLIHHDFSQPYYPGSKCDPAGPWHRQPDLAGGFAGTWDVNVWRDYITEITGGPPPIPPLPPGDDDMWIGPYLIQATGADGTKNGAVYATDGRMMQLRYLGPGEEELKGYRWTMRSYGVSAPELEDGAGILGVDTLDAYGVVLNKDEVPPR